METNELLKGKRVGFILLFGLLALLAQGINFSALYGANNQFFTLFQFFGPIAGGFLGAIAGTISILVAQVAGLLVYNKPFDWLNLLRLTPMLFAAYYFASRKSGLSLAVPLAAMALFIVHPVGGQTWYYSLFWLVPVAAALVPENLLLRSLGATFTAHAVGGIIWLYTLPTTPAFWTALIPVVVFERTVFALGISGSFVTFNALLARVENLLPEGILTVDKRYALMPVAVPVRAKKR